MTGKAYLTGRYQIERKNDQTCRDFRFGGTQGKSLKIRFNKAWNLIKWVFYISFFVSFITLVLVLSIWWLRRNHREVTNFRYFFAMIFPVFGMFVLLFIMALDLWHIAKKYNRVHKKYRAHDSSSCVTDPVWAKVIKTFASKMSLKSIQTRLKWAFFFMLIFFIFGIYFIVRTHYKTRKRDLRYTNLNEEFE